MGAGQLPIKIPTVPAPNSSVKLKVDSFSIAFLFLFFLKQPEKHIEKKVRLEIRTLEPRTVQTAFDFRFILGLNKQLNRAGHFRYFLIFSILKNDFLHFL